MQVVERGGAVVQVIERNAHRLLLCHWRRAAGGAEQPLSEDLEHTGRLQRTWRGCGEGADRVWRRGCGGEGAERAVEERVRIGCGGEGVEERVWRRGCGEGGREGRGEGTDLLWPVRADNVAQQRWDRPRLE